MPPPSPSPVSPSMPEPITPSSVQISSSMPEDDMPRWRQALRNFSNRANNICFVLTYPFMVVLTVVGLFVVIAFCIFPTLLLATMVVCVYYCLTDDPIPLSVLLRYMLSVDEDEHGHPDHYTMAQNRPVVQKKLIVREVLDVQDKTDDTEPSEEVPRRHPFPMTIVTEKKVLKYSAPLVFKDEEENENRGVAPPPVSHAFRPAPPVDEEVGIQLQPTLQADNDDDGVDDEDSLGTILRRLEEFEVAIDAEQRERRKNAAREEKASEEESMPNIRLELPSGSNDGEDADKDKDGDDEENSTSSIHDHSKMEQGTLEDGAENDVNSDDDRDESGDDTPKDAIAAQHRNKKNEDDDDQDDEEKPSAPIAISPVPFTREVKPNQAMREVQATQEMQETPQEEEEEKEGKPQEVVYDDYFGINEQQDRGTTCDICLLEFEPGDMVSWSPNIECTHCFHKDCILDWLVRKHSCPSCRKDYLKGAKDDNVPAASVSPNSSFPTSP
ncbi:unnamed protein product [Cylindrotheca closterium]|uniref:RING-type domain-containing protein n=1 Tax=Cylindrotheca closterium TaxID=2856 RepID=A0AAD2JL11_9STRA|nr:unnamed protein product [Cylindrotheca closterium]